MWNVLYWLVKTSICKPSVFGNFFEDGDDGTYLHLFSIEITIKVLRVEIE